jgi:hypothetical protein
MTPTSIVVSVVVIALALYAGNDYSRRYRPDVWNGRGACPLDDPFGTDLETFYGAIVHARRTSDWAAVERLY